MGREIIFEVRKDNKVVWPEEGHDLYVCGRDSATEYMALTVDNDSVEEDNVGNVLLLNHKDARYYRIREQLLEYYDRDLVEIQKAKDTLDDLREARRHANYSDFMKFSESMENTQEWLDDNDYSRAGTMIEYLDLCFDKLEYFIDSDVQDGIIDKQRNAQHYQVAIIWSE